jgi:heme-degrading monooxygenase HmoA
MIAQVFNLGSAPPGGAGELGSVAQAAMKETREADGCEGLYLLVGRDGAEGMAIVLWRDEAALEKMRKREAEHLDEIREETPDLPPVAQPKMFDVISA